MSALRYKDFQGSVEFEDGRLVIRILHIDDFVTTEVDRASEAQNAFAELVEDYLVTCAELGKDPCKPFKGSFNVRVAPELHRQATMSAAELNETLNAWISKAMEERLERQKTKKVLFDPTFLCRFLDDGPVSRAYSYSGAASLRHTSWRIMEDADTGNIKFPSAFREAARKVRIVQ
jgi:predicted HicB family RNase H-like nuclease